jgi:uncharacterized protein YprB with RNaseH-like and TPR domain
MKAKITKSEFTKEWGKGFNVVFYHNVWLEGQGDQPWNIGAKKQDPDFLQPGKTLEYEIADESKRKIKKLKIENQAPASGGYKPSYKQKTEAVDTNSTSLIRSLDRVAESDLIFIDIETVRVVKELKEGTPIYDAWEYKNRYNNELEKKTGERTTLEDYFNDKAALYATFGKVVVIVVARIKPDGTLSTKTYSMSKETKWSEEVLLKEFNDDIIKILEKNPSTVFAGWANKTFDQPYLAKRMYVHGIQPNILLDTNHLKPWEIPGIDLKNEWQGSAFYPDSLIACAVALGIQSPKSKMDGSEVGEYFYKGKIAEIAEYCAADVVTSVNIYRKLKNQPLLSVK